MLSSPASAARPAVTNSGASCGSAAGPTARRVIGSVIAKIITPSRPSPSPRASWRVGFMRGSAVIGVPSCFALRYSPWGRPGGLMDAVYGSVQHRPSTLRHPIARSVLVRLPAHETFLRPFRRAVTRCRHHPHRTAVGALFGADSPASDGAGHAAAVGAR